MPNKKPKSFPIQKKARQLTNADLSIDEFQKLRTVIIEKKLLPFFGRVAFCLNGKISAEFPPEGLDKVCLILCNSYERNDYQIGGGPLNDSYNIALTYFHMDYKVFYFYNAKREEFLDFLPFFLKNTQKELIIYYNGRLTQIPIGIDYNANCGAILFDQGYISSKALINILSKHSKANLKITFISDCLNGGSMIELPSTEKDNSNNDGQVVSIYAEFNKEDSINQEEREQNHGIFTFYYCKFLHDEHNLTLQELSNRIQPILEKLNVKVQCQTLNI